MENTSKKGFKKDAGDILAFFIGLSLVVLVFAVLGGIFFGFISFVLWTESDNLMDSEYHFNGKINREYVKFYESNYNMHNFLEVIQEDGTRVRYDDDFGNFKIDCVVITSKDGESIKFVDDVMGKEVLATAQKQFVEYLDEIVEIKLGKAYKNTQKLELVN